uniref:Uncharacterized protein n=1 Tax=Anopheles culicifacies TaxID=139723 RepID=A0A182MTF9_9DIPT
MEEAVNHLTNSQSTAKTMADGVIPPNYCTLPRPPRPVRLPSVAEYTERQQVPDRGTNSAHFCTLRPQPATKMGTVGGRLNLPTAGSFRRDATAENLAESNRSLLYEQNMSTFEDFCERHNSEQQLQTHQADAARDRELGPESLGQFCTLRKVRRSRSGCDTTTETSQHHPFGGAYCTLKKKKLQLNRKFVESFLEDPNAKVVDYLSELDAYLDEMDGVDDDDDVYGEVDSEGDSAGGIEDDTSAHSQSQDGKCPSAGEETVGESFQYYQTKLRGDASESGVTLDDQLYQEDRIKFGDIKHFCTLPKQKRTQFLNAFKRSASIRRSVVSQPKSADNCERGTSGTQIIPDEIRSIECAGSETRQHTNGTFKSRKPEMTGLDTIK